MPPYVNERSTVNTSSVCKTVMGGREEERKAMRLVLRIMETAVCDQATVELLFPKMVQDLLRVNSCLVQGIKRHSFNVEY